MSYRAILFILLGGGALTAVVMLAGAYNVSASSGHLPPVRALLHLTMHNSVKLRSSAQVPEDLNTEARVQAGAGHYDLVCRECHGAPDEPVNAVARHMVPAPPHIVQAVASWHPEDLFWIVKHGIKMTAMPAWPAPDRDDEVWSMVAFLLRLRDMPAEEYRRVVMGALVGEASKPGEDVVDAHLNRCARCHGYDGRGMEAWGLPRIDGLTESYLRETLDAYASGNRASGIMQAHASAVPRELLGELAKHYSESGREGLLRPPATGGNIPAAGWRDAPRSGQQDVPLGERLALQGAPERLVPACAQCHGPAPYPRSVRYPALAGQPVEYLETQLRLFRDDHRGGSAFAEVMAFAARGLEDRDIHALARYYANLDPTDSAAAMAQSRNSETPGAD